MKTSWGWVVRSKSLHHRARKGGILSQKKHHKRRTEDRKACRRKNTVRCFNCVECGAFWSLIGSLIEPLLLHNPHWDVRWFFFNGFVWSAGSISGWRDLFFFLLLPLLSNISIRYVSAQRCFYRMMHRCVGAAWGEKKHHRASYYIHGEFKVTLWDFMCISFYVFFFKNEGL